MEDFTNGDKMGVFEYMPGFVCVLKGPDHVYRYVNEAWRATGGGRDFIGRNVREVFPELEGQGLYELLDMVYANGQPYSARSLPIHLAHEEGERFIDFLFNPIKDKSGTVTGILIGGHDVTEAHRTQERWRSLAELSDCLRSASNADDLLSQATRILCLQLCVSRVGYATVDDAQTTLTVTRDWTRPEIPALAESTFLSDYGSVIEPLARGECVAIADVRQDERSRAKAADLEKKAIRSLVHVPVVENGRLAAVLYVDNAHVRTWRADELMLIREFAERIHAELDRYRAEGALRQSEERYRRLFDTIDEGFCIIEFLDGPHGPASDYIHVEANPAYAHHAGIPDVVGQKVRDMVPDEADGWVALYGGVLETGERIRFERELVATGRHLELSAVRIEPASRRQVAVLFKDISARKNAESALRQSEEQFRAFAQAIPNHVWASDPDGNVYWFNNQVYAYTGVAKDSLNGPNWAECVHPEDATIAMGIWKKALTIGKAYETQFRIRRADGAYRWFLVRAEPVRDEAGNILSWIGTNTDIENNRRQAAELERLNATLEQEVEARTSELMAAEEALRQSQKMEAVGQLTGGLAHDFNNILAGIGGSLQVMSTRLAQGRTGELERYVTGASGAVKRAAALTQRLLAFSRRQTLDPKPVDLNSLVNGMLDLVNRSVGPEISVETAGAAGLWTTFVDAGQLENALLNLCINARDAMPNGGKLTLETGNRWMDERTARQRDIEPGQYVSLCVTDTGTGMTPDVIARAFDPFYTTKPIGQGTGLGLSMVYGFAGQSGGAVKIYSELGKGTMICIYLPRYIGDAHAEDHSFESCEPPRADGGETVLLVDDEPLIRMIASEQLSELGYAVIEAEDGPSALKVLNSNRKINLLITDVGLPGGMNGRQVADAARVTRPRLEVLFITGYAENAVLNHGHLDPGMHVMTKPFQMEVFAKRVKDLIAGK